MAESADLAEETASSTNHGCSPAFDICPAADNCLVDVLEHQLFDDSLLRLWRTGAEHEGFRSKDDCYDESDFAPYVQPGEFALSKDVDVALWRDYRIFTNLEPLEEVYDFVIVNHPLLKEFKEFQRSNTCPGFSYLPLTKLLELWITTQESVHIVVQFGQKYASLHKSAIDDLVQWLHNMRDRFECEGRLVFRSLQKVLSQPASLIVQDNQPSFTSMSTDDPSANRTCTPADTHIVLTQPASPLVQPNQPGSISESSDDPSANRTCTPADTHTDGTLPDMMECSSSAGSQSDPTNSCSFVIGECFSSYKQLKDKVKAYEKARSVQLGHRDSRTLEGAKKRAPKRVEGANNELIYYSIHFTCMFGGKKFKSKSTGQRIHQRTFKQDCSAGIKLCLSLDGKYLEVTEVKEDHNHEVSKAIYNHLPRQRRLSEHEKKEVEGLLRLKVNTKLLQQHLSDTTGKVVTLKDIRNVQTGIHAQSDKNNLEALVARLRKIYGSTVEIFTNEDKTFSGLLFQDGLMKTTFAAYPEVLMVDATYKLNELRMPVYLMLVIDSNGQSEIVGVFLTALETEEAISKMVQAFKVHNPSWPSTNVVMTDKDFTERAVFRKEFPCASLLICLFHTLRSMKREVTCEKLGLRPGERDHALEMMTKLVYSKSEAEYMQHYQTLLDSGLQSVIYYYNSNWHLIRREWVECFKGANFTVGERTNNRLESINAKVKSVCSKYATLSTFFDQLFTVLSCLRNERDHVTLMAMVKKRVTTLPQESPEEHFAKLLTPYALGYVEKQLALRKKVVVVEDRGVNCTVSSSAGNLTVTAEGCQCTFWTSMHLPCRHMFAVREKMKLPVFSSVGVAQRWKVTYMREIFTRKRTATPDDSFQITSINRERMKTILSQQQKFRKALSVAQELSSLASEVGMDEFEERLSLLKQLRDTWANGVKATVQAVSNDDKDDPTLVENKGTETHTSDEHHEGSGDGDKSECKGNKISSDSESDTGLRDLKLPPKIRKRGRPKGGEKTVIGLPRKKQKGNKTIPFLKKCPADKERVILLWFVEPEVADAALAGTIIEEEQVETRPEQVSASCLDENVCLRSCQKYFSHDAWTAVSQVVESIKKYTVWYCGRCTCPISDDTEDSIVCDCCLVWYHFKCTGLRQNPKARVWFCRSCHAL